MRVWRKKFFKLSADWFKIFLAQSEAEIYGKEQANFDRIFVNFLHDSIFARAYLFYTRTNQDQIYIA